MEVLRKVSYSAHPLETLQQVLKANEDRFKRVFQEQREKLFPPSGDPPPSDTVDISLLYVFIQKFCTDCKLKAPASTGWNKMPEDDSDRSRGLPESTGSEINTATGFPPAFQMTNLKTNGRRYHRHWWNWNLIKAK